MSSDEINATCIVDECAMETHNCHANANCTDTAASFECTCHEGYSGNGTACSNIDECDIEMHSCHGNATCTDTQGSYTCQCGPEYAGDGFKCTENEKTTTEKKTNKKLWIIVGVSAGGGFLFLMGVIYGVGYHCKKSSDDFETHPTTLYGKSSI